MDLILLPETRPFGIAGLTLVGLLVLEIVSLLIGLSASGLLDKGIHFDHDGDMGWFGGIFGWLNAGHVPLLVLLMLLLGLFAAFGYVLQSLMLGVAGHALPAWMAGSAAFVAAIPATRRCSRAIARIVPGDETYAAEHADFIGRTAVVTIGPLDQGKPGRVKLQDTHGNWHFLISRAAPGHGPFPTGSTVLLVEHAAGIFSVIAPDDILLTPST